MKNTKLLFCIAVALLVYGNAGLMADKGESRIYPIYDVTQECLMGAWTDGGWIASDSAARYIAGGEKYEFYSMYRPHVTVEGSKTTNDEMSPCPEVMKIEFNGCANVNEHLIAFSGGWDALPRIPKAMKANARIKKLADSYLKKNGIKKTKIKITQVYLIDIEGKGNQDTVITATYNRGDYFGYPKPGDYSIVILQRNINGASVTIPILWDIHTEEDNSLIYTHEVLGFFDFNNDGRLEILLSEAYYEGRYSVLMGIENDTPVHYLDCGCGV
jgi:hypothetical protein